MHSYSNKIINICGFTKLFIFQNGLRLENSQWIQNAFLLAMTSLISIVCVGCDAPMCHIVDLIEFLHHFGPVSAVRYK